MSLDTRTIDDAITEQQVRKRLDRIINENLTIREREAIRLKFGLDGEPLLTQEKIAERQNISRGRVHQILARAFYKLTQPRCIKVLRPLLDQQDCRTINAPLEVCKKRWAEQVMVKQRTLSRYQKLNDYHPIQRQRPLWFNRINRFNQSDCPTCGWTMQNDDNGTDMFCGRCGTRQYL